MKLIREILREAEVANYRDKYPKLTSFDALPPSPPWGFWVLPDGSFIVISAMGHSHAVKAWLDVDPYDNAMDVAREKRWIDVALHGKMLCVRDSKFMNPSRAQVSCINDVAEFYGLTVMPE